MTETTASGLRGPTRRWSSYDGGDRLPRRQDTLDGHSQEGVRAGTEHRRAVGDARQDHVRRRHQWDLRAGQIEAVGLGTTVSINAAPVTWFAWSSCTLPSLTTCLTAVLDAHSRGAIRPHRVRQPSRQVNNGKSSPRWATSWARTCCVVRPLLRRRLAPTFGTLLAVRVGPPGDPASDRGHRSG